MSSRYAIKVKEPITRCEEIALRTKEAFDQRKTRREYKFRGGSEELPIISLPQDYLLYRLENYRTRDQQLSLCAAGKVSRDFFTSDRREDPAVQQVQHELLLQQARRGSGESIKPIYEELARVGEQTDELIITADGVVVNGNRRLAAMRELYLESEVAYGKFLDVLCLVLPESATEEEILRLEIGLQMQPETKLPYEWTALGRAVRDLRAKGLKDDAIAALMNRDQVDIQRAAKMIDAADLYLSEWLEKPDAYNLIDDTEQAFKQIATRNWEKGDEPLLREQTRKFDFFVVEHRDQLSDRAYSLINAIELNPRRFLDTIAREWDIPLKEQAPSNNQQMKIRFDSPQDQPAALDYSPLVTRLRQLRDDSNLKEDGVKSVEQVCAIVAEQGKEREKAALKFSKSAEKALRSIDLTTADPATLADIAASLARCVEMCEKLSEEIESRRARKH